MCYKISVFASSMNFFPHAGKEILKKRLRKPSSCYLNSNKIWGITTACNNRVREGAEFTPLQVFICLWRFSCFDNVMLFLHQLRFQGKLRACAVFQRALQGVKFLLYLI